MRKIFKNLFSILTIFSLLFVFSCTEDENKVETNINHGLTHKKIPLKEIAKNKKLFEKLGKLNENKITTKNINGKIVYSNEYGFYVDTDYANYIEDENGKHSYVFSVYRDSVENKLDNIVFSSQEDNTYKVVLISYDLTQEEQDNLEKGILINVFDNPRTVYIVENENLSNDIFSKMIMITSDSGCITLIQTSCSYGNHQDGMIAGFNCPGYIETQTWTNCDTGGGYYTPSGNTSGSTSTGTNGSYPSGGNGGNSSSNNNNPNPIYTTPTFPSKEQILKDKFLKQLTNNFLDPNSPKQCFNNLPQEDKDEILDYVGSFALQFVEGGSTNTNTGTSEEAVFGFAEEAITNLCSGGEVDFDDEIILDSTIVNNQKVKCVYDKLKELSSTVFNDIINDHFESSKNSKIKFLIGNTPNGEDAITLPYIGNINDNTSTSNYKIIINSNIVNNLSTIEIALILIHESIHAELLERCFRLGLINNITFVGGLPVGISLVNSPNTLTLQESIFNALTLEYFNYGGGNSQWTHDIFTIFNYNNEMAQNLVDIHPWLNDTSNDYLSNINNDVFNIVGTYNLQQVMKYISWIGLEGTQDYINNISSNPTELAKKNYIENTARNKYTNTCN